MLRTLFATRMQYISRRTFTTRGDLGSGLGRLKEGEKAMEDQFIRQQEERALKALKEKSGQKPSEPYSEAADKPVPPTGKSPQPVNPRVETEASKAPVNPKETDPSPIKGTAPHPEGLHPTGQHVHPAVVSARGSLARYTAILLAGLYLGGSFEYSRSQSFRDSIHNSAPFLAPAFEPVAGLLGYQGDRRPKPATPGSKQAAIEEELNIAEMALNELMRQPRSAENEQLKKAIIDEVRDLKLKLANILERGEM
eukprot:TRINITY_DN431_c0_g1::TRINITY_DN431_c0_g1_i1::g.2458::m.2458 TRINITY_DN431_c0_g1::TRINITY_DN431_c0_g1_i1::g.2458  ORF type:complete len:253 (+),score=15.12,IATP/PF04568.7/0.0083,IATP/PF04568.7/2.3e+03 TRINITY_DN431_c0_g1_i1:90-848(+)